MVLSMELATLCLLGLWRSSWYSKTALETLGSAVGNDIADGIGASPAGEETASIDKFNTVFTYEIWGWDFWRNLWPIRFPSMIII